LFEISSYKSSELVNEVVEARNAGLKTLSLSGLFHNFTTLGTSIERITTELLPMIEHALREGTTGSGGTESLGETEGFSDGEESLEQDERGTLDRLFRLDNTTTLGDAAVDTTYSVVGGLNLDQEDWFLEAGRGGQFGSEEDTSHSGGDLTTTSVDSVSVEGNIFDVEAAASHVLVSHDTFFGGPLEGSFA